jgi:hypothetical protein
MKRTAIAEFDRRILMKKRQKIKHKIILLALSSFFFVHPVLHEGHTISETAIFHSAPVIEHQHWDNLFFAGREKNYRGPQYLTLSLSFSTPDLVHSLCPQPLMLAISNPQSAILRC